MCHCVLHNPEESSQAVETVPLAVAGTHSIQHHLYMSPQVRNLKKKLQQIEALEARQQGGQLDPQQHAKLAQKAEVCATLEALHSGASLEEAHKIAQAHKPTSMVTSAAASVRRSPSTLSMDSSTSKSKSSSAGKHKQAASRLSSRQDLSHPLAQALDASNTCPQGTLAPSPQGRTGPPTELESHAPQAVLDRPAQCGIPATQLSTPAPQAEAASTSAAPAAAAASGGKPSAWGCPQAPPPAASLRVSGFSTPQRQKAEVPAWATPASVPPVSFASSASTLPYAPSAAAKKVKPPRKGGLSMFLSGEPLRCVVLSCTDTPSAGLFHVFGGHRLYSHVQVGGCDGLHYCASMCSQLEVAWWQQCRWTMSYHGCNAGLCHASST